MADMDYGGYLDLDRLLSAQHPLSPDHNELLFIVQHQTSELWIKLMLHELHAVRDHIRTGDLPPAFKMLARVARLLDQLVHAWDVLATLTPPEYSAIRPYLASASGFQSFQYRELEFILGNRNPARLAACQGAPEWQPHDPGRHWALYELAEKLVDLETAFRVWRFRHVLTVERIIGAKPGTGGTAGASYLRRALDVVLFPELFALRTAL